MNSKIEYFKNKFSKFEDNFYILDKNDAYVDNFGKQWRDYRNVQIDSYNNFKISKEYLNEMVFNNVSVLKDKNILEIGSGAGRFTEYLVKYAKTCVSVDLSSSIYHNISRNEENVTLIKADFNKLLIDKKFDIIFCRGVLQHTPNPLYSLLKIHSFVKNDGYVFFDIYKISRIGYAHPKYFLWRPLIKKIYKYEKFENFLKKRIEILLKLKRLVKKIFFNSDFFSDCIIPIWDYKGKLDISNEKLKLWSIMDTLDGIYAKYDYPQSNRKIVNFLNSNKIIIINNNKLKNILQTKVSNE